jgi:hypothetical protein
MLVHIAYASTAAVPFDHQELLDLLSKVRERNAQLDITGLLLHQSGDFFQVIEGSQLAITQLFAEIGEDDRHRDVVKIIEEPIQKRQFEDWTMALADVTQAELGEIEGLNDFFGKGLMFSQLGAAAAGEADSPQ